MTTRDVGVGTTTSDIMHRDVTSIGRDDKLSTAARRMAETDVGALPVCREDGRVVGVITDRDIVVRCIATGDDPGVVEVRAIVGDDVFTVTVDTPLIEALTLMEERKIRRLPVVDDENRIVGIISEADIARNLPDYTVGRFVETICAPAALEGY